MMDVGARLYGGRWNSPGHDAIYTSGNLTLAMLESLITPVLAVPSVIIPPELRYDPAYLDYVINPKHPDCATRAVPGSIHDLVRDPRFLVQASEPRSGQ
ncbi:MAG: RES domain-containing protein [Trueperaceae bacterium]|nr:RES domain-containing protein [Trueperaceae bacterium]